MAFLKKNYANLKVSLLNGMTDELVQVYGELRFVAVTGFVTV